MFKKDCTIGDELNRENSKMLRRLSSPNYGSVSTIDNTSSDSGYTELLLGGVPCPTCRGYGHVPKEQEGQLIALIPLNDKRLKPRRTYLYVGLAVFLCLATAGLLVFFIFPRDVQLKSQRPYLHPSQVYVNVSERFVSFFIMNYFTLINENYFPVLVTGVEMSVQYDTQVINSTRNQSVLWIPLREKKKYYIQIQITFDKVNQLGFMIGNCLNPIRWVHEMVMFFQDTTTGNEVITSVSSLHQEKECHSLLTASYTFLGHAEQTTLTTFQFVSCYGGNETYLSRT